MAGQPSGSGGKGFIEMVNLQQFGWRRRATIKNRARGLATTPLQKTDYNTPHRTLASAHKFIYASLHKGWGIMSDNGDKKALVSVEDVVGLSRPATRLIDAISNATGVLYEPTRIRRKAKAERDAQIIAAETRIQITDVERRGLERLAREEGRKQRNIESIIDKAIPDVDDKSNPNNVDPDWFMHFMDNAKKVSNEEIQDVWSKILSGEVNAPGSFSKRTLNILGELPQREAKLFELVCRFVVNELNEPMIFSAGRDIYSDYNLRFPTLKSLEEYGLIEYNGISGFRIDIPTEDIGKSLTLTYFNSRISFSSLKSRLKTGQVRFTASGRELRSIVRVQPVSKFVDYLVNQWKDHGATVLS